jgi:hypothetical protein
MDQHKGRAQGFRFRNRLRRRRRRAGRLLERQPHSPAAVTADTPPAPVMTAGERATIMYCNHEEARITEPARLHGPAPAAVYVHGCSWVSGNYDTGGFISGTNARQFDVNANEIGAVGPECGWAPGRVAGHRRAVGTYDPAVQRGRCRLPVRKGPLR